ncbi:SPCC736.13 [Symbiodinium sp. CCMP2592]|nr:SPCC736.13 [Symbiodinium sp. CCMP2592]
MEIWDLYFGLSMCSRRGAPGFRPAARCQPACGQIWQCQGPSGVNSRSTSRSVRSGKDAAPTPAAARDEIREVRGLGRAGHLAGFPALQAFDVEKAVVQLQSKKFALGYCADPLVTRNLQHLQADLMKPLQEALDNEPSEDMVPWVDTLLSEVETQVQQLQEQAQICMRGCPGRLVEGGVQGAEAAAQAVDRGVWKAVVNNVMKGHAQGPASYSTRSGALCISPDKVAIASSPQVGRLASIKSEAIRSDMGTPTDSAFGSVAYPGALLGSIPELPSNLAAAHLQFMIHKAATSPSADPFGSAKSQAPVVWFRNADFQAAQSPTSGAFGSMKSQVPPSPAGPADASRSQAAQSPSAGAFGSVKSQAQQLAHESNGVPVLPSNSFCHAAAQSPTSGAFGSMKSQVPPSPAGPAAADASRSQAAQSPTSGAFGSMKSQVLPSPAGPADASRSQAAQSPSAGAFGSVKSQVPPSPPAWPAAQQSPGGAFGSLSSFKVPPSPAAGSSASEAARSPAAGPTVSFASQGPASPPSGSPPAADPWQSLRSWMGDPFGTSANQTSTAAWPAAQVSSPDVGKRNSFSSKSPASARFDMWPKAAGDTEPAPGWPSDASDTPLDASPALAAQQSPAGGRSVASAASVRLKREQEAAKRTLASAMGGSQPDMHFLATAVHGAKSCGLDEAEPDLVHQAERTLEKAQRETSMAELRESLGSATSAVSARLSTQDPAPEDVTRLRSVLGEARASASFSDAELVQAEQTLFKASQLQQATLQQAASAAASPKPPQASSPARVPVAPAAATPMSSPASPASPASPTPPAEQLAMKDKVSKLLQTLLAGGSAPESLRKAAEVAAAAGLAPEICAYARSAAESRSIAHEKAVAALASGNLDAIRQAKIDVELAGGPNSDLRQLTQVLDMQRGPARALREGDPNFGAPPMLPSQVDVEELRQREELWPETCGKKLRDESWT